MEVQGGNRKLEKKTGGRGNGIAQIADTRRLGREIKESWKERGKTEGHKKKRPGGKTCFDRTPEVDGFGILSFERKKRLP